MQTGEESRERSERQVGAIGSLLSHGPNGYVTAWARSLPSARLSASLSPPVYNGRGDIGDASDAGCGWFKPRPSAEAPPNLTIRRQPLVGRAHNAQASTRRSTPTNHVNTQQFVYMGPIRIVVDR